MRKVSINMAMEMSDYRRRLGKKKDKRKMESDTQKERSECSLPPKSPSRIIPVVVTTDISAQAISDHPGWWEGHAPEFCNLTARDHTISHKCSEIWKNGKMTNRCSQVALMYSWWEEINGSRKEHWWKPEMNAESQQPSYHRVFKSLL